MEKRHIPQATVQRVTKMIDRIEQAIRGALAIVCQVDAEIATLQNEYFQQVNEEVAALAPEPNGVRLCFEYLDVRERKRPGRFSACVPIGAELHYWAPATISYPGGLNCYLTTAYLGDAAIDLMCRRQPMVDIFYAQRQHLKRLKERLESLHGTAEKVVKKWIGLQSEPTRAELAEKYYREKWRRPRKRAKAS